MTNFSLKKAPLTRSSSAPLNISHTSLRNDNDLNHATFRCHNNVPRITISEFSSLGIDSEYEFQDSDDYNYISEANECECCYVTLEDCKQFSKKAGNSRLERLKSQEDVWSYTNTSSSFDDDISDQDLESIKDVPVLTPKKVGHYF